MNWHPSKNYICSVDECLEKHYALGLCHKHWNRKNLKDKQDNSMWSGKSGIEVREELDNALQILTIREREILDMRMEGNTLSFTAEKLSLSRERIRQVEEGAIKKMRRYITTKGGQNAHGN